MQFNNETLKEKINLFKIFIVVFILLFAINIGIITASKNAVKQKEVAVLEAKRPANISLVVIKDSNCTDCADVNLIINIVKKSNVKIIKEETFEAASPEAKKLIGELEIKKLPTFILNGELNKSVDVAKLLSQIGEIKNNTFKFTYPVAPYLDLASGAVKGKVTVTFVNDKNCKECYDASLIKQILENNFGMANLTVVSLDRSDKLAGRLIAKYRIEAEPLFILTGEVSEYPNLAGIWSQVGTVEKDGAYVLRYINKVNPNFVYRDLTTGKIVKPEVKK